MKQQRHSLFLFHFTFTLVHVHYRKIRLTSCLQDKKCKKVNWQSSRSTQSFSQHFSNRLPSPHQSLHNAYTQTPSLMSSHVAFFSTLGACQTAVVSKYRPSLYKDAACVKNTKIFMSCWESRLLLLFILPIVSPPAAQHEPPLTTKPHKHKSMHAQAHTLIHNQVHATPIVPSNHSSVFNRPTANLVSPDWACLFHDWLIKYFLHNKYIYGVCRCFFLHTLLSLLQFNDAKWLKRK